MSQFPFFPHTGEDVSRMLKRIGLSSLEELYADVPQEFLYRGEYDLPSALTEAETKARLEELAAKNRKLTIFAGQGAYDHYTPSVIPALAARSEFLTAYTPYQCEISQGTLRYIFEFQSMICALTGLDVANASVYDGPTATAEAARMCVASTRKRNRILASAALLPCVRKVLEAYAVFGGYALSISDNPLSALDASVAGVILPSVDKYGRVCDLDGAADAVHAAGALLVLYCDPSALAVLRTPADWGADIAVGDAQPLGMPLSYGGPYAGFMACREPLMRKLPGRIVGQAADGEGRRCFVLTLQAREQHIRREKATSNICSNESLMALWATLYLSLMGPQGMKELNAACYRSSHYLRDKLLATGLFDAPPEGDFVKEFVLRPRVDAKRLHKYLLDKGFFAALPAEEGFVSFCVTERRTRAEIDALIAAVEQFAGEEGK